MRPHIFPRRNRARRVRECDCRPTGEFAGEPKLATTRHQISVNGSVLKYTARVGLIPILNNEAGDVHGHFGFVSYTLDRAPRQPPRPVVFVWNGGPGANSTTVHFVGFGPRRLRELRRSQRIRLRRRCRWSSTTTTPHGSISPTSCSSIPSEQDSVGRPNPNTPPSFSTRSAISRRRRSSFVSISRASICSTLRCSSPARATAHGARQEPPRRWRKRAFASLGSFSSRAECRWARSRPTRYGRRCSSQVVPRPRSIIRSSRPSCCATRRRRSTKRANGR